MRNLNKLPKRKSSLLQSEPGSGAGSETYISWRAKKKTQKSIFLLLAIGPSLGGYLLFNLYPNFLSVYYSLLDWDGVGEKVFVGLDNFKRMFSDPYLGIGLRNNLIISIIVPFVVFSISLLLAYALTHKNFKENFIYRNIYFIPNVLSSVVVSLLFIFVYNGPYGMLNALLKVFGIDTGKFYWLGSEQTALGALIVAMIWGGVGTYLVIFMNAMNGIPKTIYESAILDGATNMQRLFKITIPLIWSTVKVSLLFYIVGLFKGYEFIKIMTDGGPGMSTYVVGLRMFNLAFGTKGGGIATHDYGYASAIGMLLFVILITAKLLIDKFGKSESVEY